MVTYCFHPARTRARNNAGRYCNLVQVGGTFTDGFYAIPFSKSRTAAEIDALSSLVVTAVAFGDYGVGTGIPTFGGDRPTCAAYLAQQVALANSYDLQPLSFTQLSGIFFVLVLGMGSAGLVWLLFYVKERTLGTNFRASGGMRRLMSDGFGSFRAGGSEGGAPSGTPGGGGGGGGSGELEEEEDFGGGEARAFSLSFSSPFLLAPPAAPCALPALTAPVCCSSHPLVLPLRFPPQVLQPISYGGVQGHGGAGAKGGDVRRSVVTVNGRRTDRRGFGCAERQRDRELMRRHAGCSLLVCTLRFWFPRCCVRFNPALLRAGTPIICR